MGEERRDGEGGEAGGGGADRLKVEKVKKSGVGEMDSGVGRPLCRCKRGSRGAMG